MNVVDQLRLALLDTEVAVADATADDRSSQPAADVAHTLQVDVRPVSRSATPHLWEVDGDQFVVLLQQAFNLPATGVLTISQPSDDAIPETHEVLTADVSTIADANGFDPADFEYRWFRGTTEIAGATDASYTVGPADVGHTIRVQVGFEDGDGFMESLTSEPTAAAQFAPGLVFTLEDTADRTKAVTKIVVPEGRTATYYVRLSTAPTEAVTVSTAIRPGYTIPSGTALSFSATNWQTRQAVTIRGGDDADAADELTTVGYTIASDDPGYSGLEIDLDVRIEDDEPVPIAIAADEATVAEGVATSFTLTRDAHTDEELTVYVTVAEPRPGAGAPTPVTFALGDTTAALNATPVPDDFIEGDSELTVTVVEIVAGQTEYATGESRLHPRHRRRHGGAGVPDRPPLHRRGRRGRLGGDHRDHQRQDFRHAADLRDHARRHGRGGQRLHLRRLGGPDLHQALPDGPAGLREQRHGHDHRGRRRSAGAERDDHAGGESRRRRVHRGRPDAHADDHHLATTTRPRRWPSAA